MHSSDNTDVLATNIDTSSGSYTVPAWWVLDYGNGYTLQAQQGAGGDVVAEVGGLSLGGGVGEVTTDAQGSLSFISTAAIETASQASAATGGSAVTGAPGEEGSVTILSGTGSGTATGSGSAATQTVESSSESEGSASSTGSESSSSESESSASRTGSAAASATSETGDNAAGGVRAAVGGVLGALAVALMA